MVRESFHRGRSGAFNIAIDLLEQEERIPRNVVKDLKAKLLERRGELTIMDL